MNTIKKFIRGFFIGIWIRMLAVVLLHYVLSEKYLWLTADQLMNLKFVVTGGALGYLLGDCKK